MIKQGTPPGHSQPLLKYTERGQDRGIGADKQKKQDQQNGTISIFTREKHRIATPPPPTIIPHHISLRTCPNYGLRIIPKRTSSAWRRRAA